MDVTLPQPKYGTVYDLCGKLGYGSTLRQGPGSYHWFRLNVAKYRKAYTSTHGEFTLPLEYDHPDIQRCTASFLAKNYNLFTFECPVHIQLNDSQLRDNIAKLMCVQEYNYRYYARNTKPTEDSEGHQVADIGDTEDSDDTDGFYEESDSSSSLSSPRSSITPPSSSTRSQTCVGDSITIEAQRARDNYMADHLDFVYSINEPEGWLSCEWLKPGRPIECPDDVRPGVYRYLHEHSLYFANESNKGMVENFKVYMQSRFQANCNHLDGEQLSKRCKTLIVESAWGLREHGLLVKKKGLIMRAEAFDKCWRERHNRWKASAETFGSISGGSLPLQARGHKRARSLSDQFPAQRTPQSGVASAQADYPLPRELGIGSHKKQKLDPRKHTPIYRSSSETIVVDDGRAVRHPAEGSRTLTQDIPTNLAGNGCFRAPTAPMFPRSGSVNSTSTPRLELAASMTRENPSFGNSQNIPPEATLATLLQDHPPSHDGLPNVESGGNLDGNLYTLEGIDKQNLWALSSSYNIQATSGSINASTLTRSPTSASVVPAASAPIVRTTYAPTSAHIPDTSAPAISDVPATKASTATAGPRLLFLLYKQEDVPDLDPANALLRKDLQNLKTAEIFTLLAERQPHAYKSASKIEFVCKWQLLNRVSLRRHDSDHVWDKVKKDLMFFFNDARHARPEEETFEILIKCDGAKQIQDDDDEF